MRAIRPYVLASAMALAALASAGSAAAHARLISSTPAANATVAAPASLKLTFSEKLAPAFSGFDLAKTDGTKVKVKTAVSKDHLSLTGVPEGKLVPGGYTISWHAASSDDGHKLSGTVAFTVK